MGAVGEELVEHDGAAAGHEHAGHLADARGRVRHHGEDEVEEGGVEAGVGQVEAGAVHHRELHAGAGVPAGARDHPGRDVGDEDTDAFGDEFEVVGGAAADEKETLAGPRVEQGDRAPPLAGEKRTRS